MVTTGGVLREAVEPVGQSQHLLLKAREEERFASCGRSNGHLADVDAVLSNCREGTANHDVAFRGKCGTATANTALFCNSGGRIGKQLVVCWICVLPLGVMLNEIVTHGLELHLGGNVD